MSRVKKGSPIRFPVEMEDEREDPRFKAARMWAEETYGPPIGTGRLRAAFWDGDDVLKVPLDMVGVWGNYEEASTYKDPYEPRARCEIDERLTALLGIPILRMEFVEHVGWSKVSDWTWGVDCGQVGLTKDGRLVAYDWERAR